MTGYWWHLYGTAASHYLFGPSAADPALGATFGGFVGMAYVRSWDHEPTEDELAAELAESTVT